MSTSATLRSSAAAGRRFPAVVHIPATAFLSTTGIFFPWKLPFTSSSHLRCVAISTASTQECLDVIQNDLAVIKWPEKVVEDDALTNDTTPKVDEITRLVKLIRSRLQKMDDGEISVSPYDTAWVALVEDIGGGGGREPQFPASLDWISNNQLGDGSWGDEKTFSAHDRIMNTLACVVALRYWEMHPDKSDEGISFIREKFYRLEEENMEHMPIGFEVALPSLIEIARNLGIDIPNDSPGLKEIYTRRDLKLKKIPREVMHQVPTTLLHSLEGMPDLNWQKLLKLQSSDGSFLFSPSSTAFALQQTNDRNCLGYLTEMVRKFNGGVPNVYPVDLFEHLWVVDRLQRLGISRFFQPEIHGCIEYIHRYWTEKGICWARNSEIQDIDDTSMGFRLLRLHGYEVHADVFKQFENRGEFFCFSGQSDQAITGMYNLYRASQVMFPGEDILTDAKSFSRKFLQEKRANNELLDKWIITKDLPGEVGYALDVPWYASLPRVETRFFLEQYGGDDDVWIGKTLYRMPNVNNNTYLELAKLDYNNCQAVHQQEWKRIQKWYRDCNLGEFGMTEKSLLVAYFIAAATIFEAENSAERLAWAKTTILLETIARQHLSRQQKRDFVNEFRNGYKTRNRLVGTVISTLSQLSLDALVAHVRDIHGLLYEAWLKWLRMWEEQEEGDVGDGDAELLLSVINLSGDDSRNSLLEDISLVWHPHYQHLLEATNKVCRKLRLFRDQKVLDSNGCSNGGITTVEIKSDMEELVKLVLTKSSGDLDFNLKQKFLDIARSFYYTAYCNPRTINFHIDKVLFERVI